MLEWCIYHARNNVANLSEPSSVPLRPQHWTGDGTHPHTHGVKTAKNEKQRLDKCAAATSTTTIPGSLDLDIHHNENSPALNSNLSHVLSHGTHTHTYTTAHNTFSPLGTRL